MPHIKVEYHDGPSWRPHGEGDANAIADQRFAFLGHYRVASAMIDPPLDQIDLAIRNRRSGERKRRLPT